MLTRCSVTRFSEVSLSHKVNVRRQPLVLPYYCHSQPIDPTNMAVMANRHRLGIWIGVDFTATLV